MTGYTVVFHADTAIDYNEAYQWYEQQQAGLGEKYLDAVNSMVQQILTNPEIFSVKSRSGYHEAIVKNFPCTIVYRINKKQKTVFIASVHHQKKHPRSKYRR